MRAAEWLTYGCVEVGNSSRTMTYIVNIGIPNVQITECFDGVVPQSLCCYCDAISEDSYTSPAGDDAPWYDSTRPESGEFLGLIPDNIIVDPVASRSIQARYNGASIGRLRRRQRIVSVEGTMFATTARGMAFGERWLSEVLSGSLCADGCAEDELCILPSCPPDGDADPERYFRTLKEAGIIEGPSFAGRGERVPESSIQSFAFQMASGLPYLFGPEDTILDEVAFGPGAANGMAETSDWPGRATLIIEVEAVAAMTDVTIEGKVSLNDTCPVTGTADDVMPDFVYTISSLPIGGKLRFDGTRRRVDYIDPSRKVAQSGMHLLDLEGPIVWPDVPPCTSMCVSFSSTAAGLATLKQVDTEL